MLPSLISSYINAGQLKFVWHDFTWIGEESRTSAQAARCAGQQGLFWGYHDTLYNSQRGYNQGQFSSGNLIGFATDLGLDTEAFSACLTAAEDAQAIRDDFSAGRSMGIVATPVFIINGQHRVAGPQSFEFFSRMIESILATGSP